MEFLHEINDKKMMFLHYNINLSGLAVILLGFITGVSVSINVIQQANTKRLTELVDSWKYQAEHLQAELNASRNGSFEEIGVS